jgi:hypothetical protein
MAPVWCSSTAATRDAKAKEIYGEWIARHAGTDRVSGSRTADTRAALVDYFRDYAGNRAAS